MNVFSNETLYLSVTNFNDSLYTICYEAPPRVVSEGIWGGQENGRTPMKSFLPIFELQVLVIFAVTEICHFPLKRFGFPLLISQMMAGIILGTSLQLESLHHYTKVLFPYGTHDVICTISSFGFVLFIFTTGVQIDFSMITRMGCKVWTIALIGLVTPLFVGFFSLRLYFDQSATTVVTFRDMFVTILSQSMVSFATIFEVLNALQIQNSELGRLALSSALLLSATTASIGAIMMACRVNTFFNLISLFALLFLIPLVCRPAMFWVIKNTPEGRPVKGSYIYLIVAMVFALGWVSIKINQQFILGVFIFGLSVPEGPPLGSALVTKLRFFGTWFFLPIYVTTCMMKVDFSLKYPLKEVVTTSVVVLFTLMVKIIAFFLPALYYRLPIIDALSLALILCNKGVVEVSTYSMLLDLQFISGKNYGIMMLSVMVIASIVQRAVKLLNDPSRKYAGYQKRNLVSVKPTSNLRILACVHKKIHISPISNVIDLFCPTSKHPMTVDVMHLIELVGQSLPIFVSNRLRRQNSGYHKSYSDDVILAFDIYEHENLDAATVNTYTAISPPTLMYEDVCNLALDKVVSMIILPFHHRWSSENANIEANEKKVRALNIKVLEVAPCSVGILVSRGSHSIREETTRLAVIHLGGKDDREALCIARRAIRNPRVNLVVYQLVHEEYKSNLETLEDNVSLQDMMMSPHDDEDGNVCYKKIETNDGSQTVAFLRDIVNEHDFFIVGRRHGLDSPQTEGLHDWSESPELGVIGDFLASPDCGSQASILVVQQQVSKTKMWLD